jgi:hypothetical protein
VGGVVSNNRLSGAQSSEELLIFGAPLKSTGLKTSSLQVRTKLTSTKISEALRTFINTAENLIFEFAFSLNENCKFVK